VRYVFTDQPSNISLVTVDKFAFGRSLPASSTTNKTIKRFDKTVDGSFHIND
jgi:hypothetical protein